MSVAEPLPAEVPQPRCAVAALERGDPMLGTALPARRFLLVEDAGPWGPAAHPTGSLPVEAAHHVEHLAHELGARLLLVRRPGRGASTGERSASPSPTWRPARSGGAACPSAGALAGIDPLRGTTVLGRAAHYLVCTHGRHDTCCALEGRPLARELALRSPDNVWECSHLGGDRFAANLLVLPTTAWSTAARPRPTWPSWLGPEAAGRVVTRLLRGRCGIAPAAQVAEAHRARGRGTRKRVGAIEVDDVRHTGPDTWLVHGHHRDDRARSFVAELHESHRPVSTGLTCSAPGPGRLRDWTLVALEL
ncbi:MAG: sucrase ferredoxin [Candidatus Nanopelagicales bacterium]